MGEAIVSLKNVGVEYRQETGTPVTALTAINLELYRGEKIAVYGPNGSGKSTLLRIMAGLERPAHGTATIFGHPTTTGELPADIRQCIGFVFQNPEDVFATETVGEEIQFALECRDNESLPESRNLTIILDKFNLTHLAGRKLARLSGGEKQQVALASVLAVAPEMIFLDEPTSYLDPPSRREFLQSPVFNDPPREHTTILVTQYWAEARTHDRVLILDRGRIIHDGPPDTYTLEEKQNTSTFIEFDDNWLTAVAAPLADPLLVVDNLRQTAPVFPGELIHPLQDISYTVRPGERVGIVGPTGAGKSTLAYHLAGLMPGHAGTIAIAGEKVSGKKKKSKRPPVALLFQNPDHHLFAETVAQDVAFGPRNVGIPRKTITTHVDRSLKLAGLPPDIFGPRSPFEISGGEQRKAATAGTLAMPAEVYIFDEPTAYLDCESAAQIEALLLSLAAAGKAVLVISHDLPFLRRTCPRWLILDRGKLIYDGTLEQINRDQTPLQKIGFV
ncbi:ABC transporter ATP-binding protein [Candidatus Zixiibacteriota bacterium]